MDRVVRVLIVDDSAYVRKVVRQMLSRSPFIEVVGTARDGVEALEMVELLQPDVVTLDLIMPQMDGITFLQQQMARRPVPVVVVSIASESGDMALRALDAGAIDFVQKPTALATEKIFEISDELISKVKTAAGVQMTRVPPPPAAALPLAPSKPRISQADVLVIGISTGGPQALKLVIPQLPADFPIPVAIVLHMPVGYTEMYAQKLDEISRIEVHEAHEGDLLRPGAALLAPAGRHLTFRREADGSVVAHLDARPFDTPHRPAVDVLFRSAADIFGARVLGVVMTGMGADGKEGAAWIKAQGGTIFTEAEETCVVYGMPRSVDEAGLSDRSVPLYDMARAIMETV
ncbi:MAG: chemotaxis response regulator protein-glutamate methylesterase [Chloroflexi bacterium]|nr:chemotaxis response regulator protein-glutamate methylesterase [Chloroflexota bacterium]